MQRLFHVPSQKLTLVGNVFLGRLISYKDQKLLNDLAITRTRLPNLILNLGKIKSPDTQEKVIEEFLVD